MKKLFILPLTLVLASCFSSSFPTIEEILVRDTIIRIRWVTDTTYVHDTIVVYEEGHSGGKAW